MWNTDLIESLELENLLITAAQTMHTALARKVYITFPCFLGLSSYWPVRVCHSGVQW